MDMNEIAQIVYGMEAEQEGPGWEQQAGLEERQYIQESLESLASQIEHHVESIDVALREIERLQAFL
jgi:hypothetical protein